MKKITIGIAGLVLATLLAPGAAAATDLNEVGALLVYPFIVTDDDGRMAEVETFVTITNTGAEAVVAHVSYINGDWYDEANYCNECNFAIPLTPNDTETLVITNQGDGAYITSEDLSLNLSCPWDYGMLVVALEDENEITVTDNVLLGEEVVVNYEEGAAFSIPAISFQGVNGNGDRHYDFDGQEYGMLPRVVAADYLAPDIKGSGYVLLSLFTLGFTRNFPPLVDCSVTGYDAHENPVSASFVFGCWSIVDICEVSPEYCYPNLGLFNGEPGDPSNDTHGWFQLNCKVDVDPTESNGWDALGGVHGAIVQNQDLGSYMAAGSGAEFYSAAGWGRLLYQSVTTGDAVTLELENPAGGLD